MKRISITGVCAALSCVAAGGLTLGMLAHSARGQEIGPPMEEPVHEQGDDITGALEGWFANPDGTFSILVGYYNRNVKQILDIPIGPNNKIEPGGPDQGQPTHFLTRRQWGMFTVRVPKDFGDKKLTWSITANGRTTSIPLSLNPLWEISPFHEESMGNTPPKLAFDEGGASVQGPKGFTKAVTVTMPDPLDLTVYVADDAKVLPGSRRAPTGPPVTVTWSKLRGPGEVKFAEPKPKVDKGAGKPIAEATFTGKAQTSATFDKPGEYVLHAVANDWSGEGGRGFQCCWTYGDLKVSVKPAAGGK